MIKPPNLLSLYHHTTQSTQKPKLDLARSGKTTAPGTLPFAKHTAASASSSINTTASTNNTRAISSFSSTTTTSINKRTLPASTISTTTSAGKKKKGISMLDQVLGAGTGDDDDEMERGDDDILHESDRLFASSPEKGGKINPSSGAFSSLFRDGSSRMYGTKPPPRLGAPSSSSSSQSSAGKGKSLTRRIGDMGALSSSSSSTSSFPFSSSSSSSSSSLTIGGKREGLLNLGNTCYLNSVVQALAAAGEFVNDLLSTFWLRQTLPDLRQPVEGPRHLKVYGSFAGLLLLLRQKTAGSSSSSSTTTNTTTTSSSSSSSRGSGSGGVTDPSQFRREVASYFAAYGGGRQQDAHEFLGDLLNSLQEELCLYGRRFAAQKIQADKEAAAARANANRLVEGDRGREDEKEGKGPIKKQSTVGKGGKGGPNEAGGGKGGQTSLRTFFRSRSLYLMPAPSSLTLASSRHMEGEKEAVKQGSALTEAIGEDTVISQEEAATLERILPVTRHFHAEVEKTLTCVGTDCAYSRSYIEPFTDFSVDLVAPGEEGEDASSSSEGGSIPLQLFDLLAHSFQEQELELACERCQRQNKVRVTYRFRKLPHLLVVHLKRFRITGGLGLLGASSSKLPTRVMAPATLDLAQFCDARTANPRDVSTGLEGPAGPQLTKPLLESLAATSSPPASATRFGTYFKSAASAATADKGGKEEDGQGTNSTPLSKILQEVEGSAAQRLKLQQQRKEAAARDKKEQDESRWPTEEGSKRTTPSLPAEDPIVSSSPSDPMLVDLVDGGSSAGGSQEDVNNKELQEAIRLSLIESRGGSGGRVGGQEDEEVQVLEKGGGRATRSGASKTSTRPTVTIDHAEDKENQLPASGKSKARAPLPLDLRNLTTRPLSSSSSSLSSPSASTTVPPPAATVRAGELQSAYALQSVVRHLGRSANSGHYIADVRRAGSTPSSPALWTRYDDALVSALPQGDRVLEDDRSLQTGYIFIYRACA